MKQSYLFGLLTLSLAVAFSACSTKEEEKPETPRLIKIVEFGGAGKSGMLEFPGELKSKNRAEMAFEVPGKIVALNAKEGMEVKKGDLLAKLDTRDFVPARDAAKAKRAQTRADYQRHEDLYAADAISLQELEIKRRMFEVADAEFRKAQKALSDAHLRAPFKGKVSKRFVENHATVQAKEPVLYLEDESSMEIEVNIPEGDWGGVREESITLQQATKRLKPKVEISAQPGELIPASFAEFSTRADPVTRTFDLTLEFEPPKGLKIFSGMTAKVIVSLDKASANQVTQKWLPALAVMADEKGKAYVWKVDPKKMRVHRAPVEAGELTGSSVAVLQGLEPGELVAVTGVAQLRENMLVGRLGQRLEKK